MSVLDPNEYVPAEDEYGYLLDDTSQPSFAQDGPRLASQGNMGALQRMAQGPQNGRLQMFDQEMADQLRERMMARVRTPEQMDQSLQQRRGALNALNEQIQKPDDDSSFFGNMMMHGSIARGKGATFGDATTLSIGQAMAQRLEQQHAAKKNNVQAAKNNYNFEGIEEKSADAAENKAMHELSRVAAAQSKPVSAAAQRSNIKIVGNRAYNFEDPNNPKLVVDKDDYGKMYMEARKMAEIRANRNAGFGAFNSLNEMKATIEADTRSILDQMLSTKVGPSPAQASTTQTGPSVGTPQQLPATAERGNLTIDPEEQAARDAEARRLVQAGIDNAKTPEEKAQFQADMEALNMEAKNRGMTKVSTAPQSSAVPQTGDTPLVPKANQEAQKTALVENEKGAAEEIKKWRASATQGEQMMTTYRNAMALRPKIQPGKFADIKKELGGYLGALGFDGSIVDQARNLEAVTGMLQQAVNDRMTAEKGVQTEGDAERFQKAFANIKQSPYAFDMMMGMIREQAERSQERARIADSHVAQNKTGSGATQAWEKYNNQNLGPMIVGDIGNGQPMWRHQWIEQAVRQTVEKYPGADPLAVKKKAEAKWVEFARSRNGQ